MQFRDDITCYGKYAAEKVGLVSGRVEVTSACFQNCKLCDSWRDHVAGRIQGEWSLNDMQNLVQQALEFPNFQFLGLTGGDPQAWTHLVDFLEWIVGVKMKLQNRNLMLQLDTAFMKLPFIGLWKRAVDRVRVSLDAINPDVYTTMRGVGNPEAIIEHMMKLSGMSFSTITTVCEDNICEVPAIIKKLEELVGKGLQLRKAMFLAAIDHRKSNQGEEFWRIWKNFEKIGTSIPTSFAGESVREARKFCKSDAAKTIRCWVPYISFYAKANGDFYPCCLAGGEAVTTHSDFYIGNFKGLTLRQIWNEYEAVPFYAHRPACRELCQFKQLNLNVAAEIAARNILTMP